MGRRGDGDTSENQKSSGGSSNVDSDMKRIMTREKSHVLSR